MAKGTRLWGQARGEDQYLLVVVLLFASMLAMAVSPRTAAGAAGSLTILALTLVETFRTSGWPLSRPTVAGVVVASCALVGGVAVLSEADDVADAIGAAVAICIVCAAITAIVKRIVTHPEISLKTVVGALCIYLYFVLLFAHVFGLMDALTAGPFFVQTDDPSNVTFLYFSLVTLSTVGFGDFTSAIDAGRVLSGIEALLGQMYMVSVVALLVGNFGKSFSRRPRPSGEDTPPEELTIIRTDDPP